jgi:hypothetical protein
MIIGTRKIVAIAFAALTPTLWGCAELQQAVNGPSKPPSSTSGCSPGIVGGKWYACPEQELQPNKASRQSPADDDETKTLISEVDGIQKRADAILETPESGDREVQQALGLARRSKNWAQGMLTRLQSTQGRRNPFGTMSDKQDAKQGIKQEKHSMDDAEKTLARAQERLKAEQALADALEKEKPALDDAKGKCTADKLRECETGCKNGDLMLCIAFGQATFAQSNASATKAVEYFRKACDGGVRSGCRDLRFAEQRVATREQTVAHEFAVVESWVDSISRLQYQAKVGRSLGPGRGGRRAQAVAAVQGEVDRKKRDEFCPAKSEFIATFGVEEFNKRAKEYCDSDRVAAEGIDSGIGETKRLRAECRQIVATPCPAKPKAAQARP